MDKDSQLLEDIFHQTFLIISKSEHIDIEDFLSDEFCQNGFIRSLEIIGEATKKISQEYRTAHPEIPWS